MLRRVVLLLVISLCLVAGSGCTTIVVLFPELDGGQALDGNGESHRDGGSLDAMSSVDAQPDAVCGTGSCSASPCRLVSPQCGCPCGQACYASLAGPTCATAGTAGVNEACNTDGDCRAGLACVGVNGASACTPYCDSDAQCTSQVCWMGSGANVCPHACDLAAQTGCPTGEDCIDLKGTSVDTGAQVRSSVCGIKPASGAVGTDCTGESITNWICGPGLFCVSNACQRYCRIDAPACPAGKTCRSVSPPVTVGTVVYGACL